MPQIDLASVVTWIKSSDMSPSAHCQELPPSSSVCPQPPWRSLHAAAGGTQDCWSVLGLCAIAFYYLALLSHHPTDPSYYVAVAPSTTAANLGGSFGAELSAHALAQLGHAAYLLPALILFCLIRRPATTASSGSPSRWLRGLASWWRGLWILALISLWLELLAPDQANWGGWVGYHLSALALDHFGTIGVWLALFTGSAVYLTYEFKLHLRAWSVKIITSTIGYFGRSVRSSSRAGYHLLRHSGRSLASQLLSKSLLRLNFKQLNLAAPAPASSSGVEVTPRAVVNQAAGRRSEPSPRSSLRTVLQWPFKANSPLDDTGEAGDTGDVNEPNPRTGKLPPLLSSPSSASDHLAAVLKQTLLDFHIKGQLHGYEAGPRLITYDFEPESGIKQTKLTSLADDIARALKVESVLIQPIAGTSSLGIQVPRPDPYLINLIDEAPQRGLTSHALPIALGVTPSGEWIKVDLAAMPHLLMAGATGSGKSVGIHALINSLISARTPTDVRLILVDPKMLELSAYNQLPHLAAPVITEPTVACQTLKWAVSEMERRYRMMQDMEVRHMKDFNLAWQGLSPAAKARWLETYPATDVLPYLVIIIDELADLMLIAPKDVESLIQRLSQKARASGIHLVLATQRPSVDVITGVIKANFPARIAYQVVSKHDSRTILDQIGAERLLGKGDMLYQDPKRLRPMRLQGAYVGEEQIKTLMAHQRRQHPQHYLTALTEELAASASGSDESAWHDVDPKWEEALATAERKGSISASFLQRKLKIGYNRAARIIEMMEQAGYIAPSQGAKPRPWLGDTT